MIKHKRASLSSPTGIYTQQSLKEKAKKMYESGLSLVFIAEVLEIPLAQLEVWQKENTFGHLARSLRLRPMRLLRQLVESFEEQADGKKPTTNPKDLLCYAKAYQQLNAQQPHVGCWYEAYERLTEARLECIRALGDRRKRKAALHHLVTWRQCMHQVMEEAVQTTQDPHD